MQDVEEADDDGAFAPYATPDLEIIKMKSKRRALEEQSILKSSENQKLLKDALEDLSGDESPPEIPKQSFSSEEVGQKPSEVSIPKYVGAHSGLTYQPMPFQCLCNTVCLVMTHVIPFCFALVYFDTN